MLNWYGAAGGVECRLGEGPGAGYDEGEEKARGRVLGFGRAARVPI